MITHIDPRFLDVVWPEVSPVLEAAVAENHGEETLDQLRARIAFGGAALLVGDFNGSRSVAVIEFTQHANFRVAMVNYLAGETSDGAWEEFKSWARGAGASKMECRCRPVLLRLFSRYGFDEVYRVARCEL